MSDYGYCGVFICYSLKNNMRSTPVFLALLLSLSIHAFAYPHPYKKARKPTFFQGICGTVLVKRGNHMPDPDQPQRTNNGQPAQHDVLIYQLLNMSQVDAGENGFINSVRDARPIKTVKSGKNGKFCVSLPVGQYSVLVREPKGLYANLSDAQNNINPVTVQKSKRTWATISITHEAVF